MPALRATDGHLVHLLPMALTTVVEDAAGLTLDMRAPEIEWPGGKLRVIVDEQANKRCSANP